MRSALHIAAVAAALSALAMVGCQVFPASPVAEPPGLRSEPLVVRADEAMQAGDTEQALELLAAAIEQNPTLTTAHLKIGDIYRSQGDFAEAEKAYGSAARLEPRSFDAQYFHAFALQSLNRLADAIRAYLRALAIEPESFEANLNLGAAYLQLREPAQSLPYAARAVQLDPSSGPAHANLGAALGAMGEHDRAVREYQAAAELMDLTPELLLNMADSLGKLKRYDEMLNTLDASLELEESAVAWERLGYVRFKLRRYAAAQEAFRHAIEIDPRHYPALNGLGVCLLNDYLATQRQDEPLRTEAIALFRRSLKINSRQTRILELLSRFG